MAIYHCPRCDEGQLSEITPMVGDMCEECADTLSKAQRAVVDASEAGYSFDEEGQILKPDGTHQTTSPHSHRYRVFRLPRGVSSHAGRELVYAHRLIAYIRHGYELFSSDCVRHLDDSRDNDPTNIAIGTYAQNQADMTPGAKALRNQRRSVSMLARFEEKG